MSSAKNDERLQEQMEKTEAALRRGQWFEAERLAQRGMEMARRIEDFGTMARICLPLQEARRQRVQAHNIPVYPKADDNAFCHRRHK